MADFFSQKCSYCKFNRNSSKYWNTIKFEQCLWYFNGYCRNETDEIWNNEILNEEDIPDPYILNVWKSCLEYKSVWILICSFNLQMSMLEKLRLCHSPPIPIRPRFMTLSLLNWSKLLQTNLLHIFLLCCECNYQCGVFSMNWNDQRHLYAILSPRIMDNTAL